MYKHIILMWGIMDKGSYVYLCTYACIELSIVKYVMLLHGQDSKIIVLSLFRQPFLFLSTFTLTVDDDFVSL